MSVDDEFFLRLGKIGDRGAGQAEAGRGFVGEVLGTARRNGLGALGGSGRRGGGPNGGRGGLAAARSRGGARRVIVKTRIVRHRANRYRAAPMAMHIRYLRREGVTRDGKPAEMFDRDGPADHADFARRSEDDRHHFRFIVSPEDGASLQDLRATTRELMAQAETDLGARLDWIAVDHWNTDNPHVHVLLRGVVDGRDLVINPDYLTQGLRKRAEAIVSLELGPRTKVEIEASLDREVTAERWTSLDRALKARADGDHHVDLRPAGEGGAGAQTRLIGRAQTLERIGLAAHEGAVWRLASDLEPQLRALGERGDIIKALNASLKGRGDLDGLAVHGCELDAPIVGRLVDRGLHDELSGQAYAVVDGVDGRLHHLRFGDLAETGDTPIGGVVEVRTWRRPGDAPKLDLVHRSDLTIELQSTASGATWLDRQIVARDPQILATQGFGREVREAIEARRQHLRSLGLADANGRPRGDLIGTLRQTELARAASNVAAETGSTYAQAKPGDDLAGVYRRRLDLVSGRFAMIEDGLGFQLVPWTRALESRREQEVRGVISPGGGVDWALGKKRGIGL